MVFLGSVGKVEGFGRTDVVIGGGELGEFDAWCGAGRRNPRLLSKGMTAGR